MKNKTITLKVNRNGSVVVRDKRNGSIWSLPSGPVMRCWDVCSERVREISPDDCVIKPVLTGDLKTVLSFSRRDIGLTFRIHYTLTDDCLEVRVPFSSIRETDPGFRLLSISPLPGFGRTPTGEEGYLLLPNYSGIMCRFNKTKSARYGDMVYGHQRQWENFNGMPVFGTVRKNSAFLGIITSGEFDAEVITEVHQPPDSGNSIYPCLHYRYGKADDIDRVDRTVRYYFLAGGDADYAGMARTYRNYLLRVKKIKPLKEKIRNNPALTYFCSAFNDLRIYCSAKRPVENGRGRLMVYTTFPEARQIIGEMKKAGVEKAVIMLVGWTCEGGDSAYPTKLPPNAALGGEREFKKLVACAKSLNYQIINWDNYTDFHTYSPDWNPKNVIMDRDGWRTRMGVGAGGTAWAACPHKALRFARRDLPRMKDIGLEGVWYIDAIAQPLRICYDRKHGHPAVRRAYAEGLRKIVQLAGRTFGGCTVENAMDFLAGSIDGIAQIKTSPKESYVAKTYIVTHFADEFVPFYQIAYHGIFVYHLSCPWTYPSLFGSRRAGLLKEIEYGAMPRAEFGFARHQKKDLVEYRECLPFMKLQYDILCRELGYLQMEFIENHRSIFPGVYETLYSDGTRIIVNYGRKAVSVKGLSVPPASYVKSSVK